MWAFSFALDIKGRVYQYTSTEYVPQIKRANSGKSGREVTQEYVQQVLNNQTVLFLLEEPTTNLDIERIVWLERQLRAWQGALMIVSV